MYTSIFIINYNWFRIESSIIRLYTAFKGQPEPSTNLYRGAMPKWHEPRNTVSFSLSLTYPVSFSLSLTYPVYSSLSLSSLFIISSLSLSDHFPFLTFLTYSFYFLLIMFLRPFSPVPSLTFLTYSFYFLLIYRYK